MKAKFLFVILVMALLSSGFASAQTNPGTVKLNFNNKTAEQVSISLAGPAAYNFSLPPGKSSQQVLPGRYHYAYTACAEQATGSLTVKKNGDKLVLAACPKKSPTPPAAYKVVMDNKTGQALTITLKGPATYTFTLPTGKTSQLLSPGKYRYSYAACQGMKSGTLEVKKNGTLLTLAACTKNKVNPSREVNVKVLNKTGGPLRLSLSGPATYEFNVPAGKSIISVLKGKYHYTAYCYGGATHSGTKQLSSNIEWPLWCMP